MKLYAHDESDGSYREATPEEIAAATAPSPYPPHEGSTIVGRAVVGRGGFEVVVDDEYTHIHQGGADMWTLWTDDVIAVLYLARPEVFK